MGGYRLLETFATLTRRRCSGNALQLNHFGAFASFFRDIVASDLTAQHVIRRDMADDIAFGCLAVKRDNRNLRLVRHLHRVTHRIGVSRVDQQNFGPANG